MMEEIQRGFKVKSTNVFDTAGNIVPFNEKPAVKSVQQVTFDFFFPMGDTRTDGQGNFNNAQLINQTLYIINAYYAY